MIGCLTMGSKTPLLNTKIQKKKKKNTLPNYHVKCHGRFLCSLLRIHGYLTREIYHGKVRLHTLAQFPPVKGPFTTVKVFHVFAPIIRGINSRFHIFVGNNSITFLRIELLWKNSSYVSGVSVCIFVALYLCMFGCLLKVLRVGA